MKKEKIEKLFNQYEKAFDKLDLKTIAGLYSETVITAGPKGTILTTKKEFEEKSEDAANFYRNVGHKSAEIVSKKYIPISNEYTMVEVRWSVTFEITGDKTIEFDVSYIIQDTESLDEPKIIMFITHQDEEEAMKKLGILKQAVG
jgi:hypothetical protein